MSAFLSKPVVLTIAAILALPAGWCCGALAFEMGSAAAQKTECCRTQEPLGHSAPATPDPECCCSWDSAVATQAVRLLIGPAAASISSSVSGDLTAGSQFSAAAAVTPFGGGPRLHLLQCVWRC